MDTVDIFGLSVDLHLFSSNDSCDRGCCAFFWRLSMSFIILY